MPSVLAGHHPYWPGLLKSRLETLIPATYGRLAALARAFRADVQARFSNARDRRIFWEDILQGPTAELVFARRESEAHESLKQALNTTDPTPHRAVRCGIGGVQCLFQRFVGFGFSAGKHKFGRWPLQNVFPEDSTVTCIAKSRLHVCSESPGQCRETSIGGRDKRFKPGFEQSGPVWVMPRQY